MANEYHLDHLNPGPTRVSEAGVQRNRNLLWQLQFGRKLDCYDKEREPSGRLRTCDAHCSQFWVSNMVCNG